MILRNGKFFYESDAQAVKFLRRMRVDKHTHLARLCDRVNLCADRAVHAPDMPRDGWCVTDRKYCYAGDIVVVRSEVDLHCGTEVESTTSTCAVPYWVIYGGYNLSDLATVYEFEQPRVT